MQKIYFTKPKIRNLPWNNSPCIRSMSIAEDTQNFTYERHSHDNLVEIAFIERGHALYTLNNKPYQAETGDIIIINSGTVHSESTIDDHTLRAWVISIENLSINDLPINCLIAEGMYPIIKTNEHYDLFIQKFNEIRSEKTNAQLCHDEICEHICAEIILLLLRLIYKTNIKDEVDPHTSLVRNIKKYIDLNYDKPITLQSLSKTFFVSTYYITHEMKDKMGISPINYLISRRIGEAQRLLLSTDDSVASISEKVGYPNIHHFTNLFKKRTSLSPSQFRETYSIHK